MKKKSRTELTCFPDLVTLGQDDFDSDLVAILRWKLHSIVGLGWPWAKNEWNLEESKGPKIEISLNKKRLACKDFPTWAKLFCPEGVDPIVDKNSQFAVVVREAGPWE